jgi:hypothetical protein
MYRRATIVSSIVCILAPAALAVPVNITTTGVVDFNIIGGEMTNVPDGAPVSMSFNVDSNIFINSGSFPTRGYAIDLNSFAMSVGGVNVPIVNPQPNGTAYFVLRNNDPAVDGFFLSTGPDFPFPLAVTIPGLTPQHELDFSVAYTNGNQITSLDILDAVGTYGTTDLAVYNWAIGRFGNHGAEYAFQQLSISVVPEPCAMSAAGALLLLSRRRR